MKVAYVTTFEAQDRASWPRKHLGLYGASTRIAQALLDEGNELSYVGGLERRRSPRTRLKWLFYHHIRNKDYYSWAEPAVLKHYARQISQRVSNTGADLVLCPENAIPIAHVKIDRPMVLWTDALLGSLVDFYPYLSNLSNETRRGLFRFEKAAVHSCDLVILTSEWAVQSAIDLYDIPRDKTAIVPRGSNRANSYSADEVRQRIALRAPSPCRLIFVGVEWSRKGGDVALKVAQSLNQMGIETELIVVGCQPQSDRPLPDFVQVKGFIDQSTAIGRRQLEDLMSSAHFLMLPTRADTFGIVLSEANALGVPCLASQVGGIPTVIQDDRNGKTFPLDACPDDYSQFIASYLSSYERYQALANSAFDEYQTRLSWEAAGSKIQPLLTGLTQ